MATEEQLNGSKPDLAEDEPEDKPENKPKDNVPDEDIKPDEPQLIPHQNDDDNKQNGQYDDQNKRMDDGHKIILNDNVITTDGGTLSYFGDDDRNKLDIRIVNTEEIKGKILKHTSFIIESSLNNDSTVSRRYNDFKWLHNVLSIEYLCTFIPPIPPASNASNILQMFDKAFISQRRYDLERFLNRVFANELLSKSQSFEVFLTQQSHQRFEELQKSIKVCNVQTVHTNIVSMCFIYKMKKIEQIPNSQKNIRE